MLLSISNLEVSYGVISTQDVSLEIDTGEIVTLIGSNGRKTTLLRAINPLVHARDGSIVYQNEEITHLPAHKIVRRGISHVPEGRQIFANLTVRAKI